MALQYKYDIEIMIKGGRKTMTELGKILKIIRIKRGEILKTMSENLGVTASYLSAVENGKRPMPSEWLEKLEKEYSLDAETMVNLQNAADKLVKSIKLDINKASNEKRDAALVFARSFDSMDEKTANDIKKMLLKGE